MGPIMGLIMGLQERRVGGQLDEEIRPLLIGIECGGMELDAQGPIRRR
jgi:hypothetical protein